MKKTDAKASSKDTAPVPTEPVEPEAPQFGHGTFEYKDLTTYVGNWKLFNGKDKLKHGHGKIVFPGQNGRGAEEYDGDWVEDKMQGNGRYSFSSGNVYTGEWLKGLMHGRGKMVNVDGTSYDGEWEHGVMHGEGVYVDKDKVSWQGIFIHGSYDSLIQKKMKVEKASADKVKEYQNKALNFFTQF